MKLTWRKEPRERGAWPSLRPRDAILRVDGADVGRVCASRVGLSQEWRGWFWYAVSDKPPIAYKNTAGESRRIYGTLDGAKADCEAYVREQLGLPAKKGKAK